MAHMKIGGISVQTVLDGYLTFPAEAEYPAVGSAEYDAHRDSLQPDGRRRMTLGSFLVRLPEAPDRLILVDAGSGKAPGTVVRPKQCDCPAHADPAIRAFHDYAQMDEGARQAHLDWLAQTETCHGFLLESLAAVNVKPEDITDVILSHMHFDHIGWISSDGAPTFPNAKIRVEQNDLAHFMRAEQAIEDGLYEAAWNVMPTAQRLAPILDRIETWSGDASLAPGFDAVATPGHTPGHSIFVLSSGTDRAMLLGDVVHCPLQLTDLDFSVMADIDADLADKQRERVYREMIGDQRIAVAGAHFPDLRFGRIIEGQGRAGWTFVN